MFFYVSLHKRIYIYRNMVDTKIINTYWSIVNVTLAQIYTRASGTHIYKYRDIYSYITLLYILKIFDLFVNNKHTHIEKSNDFVLIL